MKKKTNHIKKRIAVIVSMTLFLIISAVFAAMGQNAESHKFLYPGQMVAADLSATLGDAREPSAVFYLVSYPVASVMTVNADGRPTQAEPTQLIKPGPVNPAWIELTELSASDESSVTTVYGLSDILSPGESSTLLDTLVYADVIEGQLTGDIRVRAAVYTVPASRTGRVSGTFTPDELERIYREHIPESTEALMESETAYTPGSCDIAIVEDGSIPEIIPAGSEYHISDTIRISNTGTLACQVRVAIDFDSYISEGASELAGMDSAWSYDSGFYYYDEVLKPGEVSRPFMTGIDIASLSPEDAAAYRVGIYAEAVNAVDDPPVVSRGYDRKATDTDEPEPTDTDKPEPTDTDRPGQTDTSPQTDSSGSSGSGGSSGSSGSGGRPAGTPASVVLSDSSDSPVLSDSSDLPVLPDSSDLPVLPDSPDFSDLPVLSDSPDLSDLLVSSDDAESCLDSAAGSYGISGPHYLIITLRHSPAVLAAAEASGDASASDGNHVSFMTVFPWILAAVLLILCIIIFITAKNNKESEG